MEKNVMNFLANKILSNDSEEKKKQKKHERRKKEGKKIKLIIH